MTVGITQARHLGCTVVACASTGNTSASLAAYGALAGMSVWVFVPEGKIALGQAGAGAGVRSATLQVRGDFDAAMDLVQQVCDDSDIYLPKLDQPVPYRRPEDHHL